MNNPKTQRFLALAVPLILFGLALLFRLDGIDWGLPNAARWYSFHPDERQTVAAVLNLDFFSGDFNPNFFNYPSLYLYATYLAHFLMGGLGLTQVITPQNAQWALPRDVIVAGRFVSALLGAATIFPVYDMARRLFAPRFAGLAAFSMAMAPAAVQHSHFATVDIAATFFVALALMFAVRALTAPREYSQPEAVEKIAKLTKNNAPPKDANSKTTAVHAAPRANAVPPRDDEAREYSQENLARNLLLAALFSGFAAATKYNAILVFVAPLCAWLLLKKRAVPAASMRVLASLFGALSLGFFIGCPFSVLSFREFWGDGIYNGFAYELFVHSRQGSGDVFVRTGNGWIYHLTQNLPFALGLPLLLLTLLGVFVAARVALLARAYSREAATPTFSAENNVREYSRAFATLPLLAFGALYFLAIGLSQVRFMRYDLPLIPALCVFTAAGFAALSRFAAQKLSGAQTPHEGFSFAIERVLRMFFLLAFFMAALGVNAPLLTSDTRDDAASWLNKNAPQNASVALAADRIWFSSPPLSPQDAPPPGLVIDNAEAFAKQSRYRLSALDFNARRLSAERPQFVVINEFDWRDKARLNDRNYRAFMEVLGREYSQPHIFSSPQPLLPGRDFAPHDFLYTWPQTRVYRRKS